MHRRRLERHGELIVRAEVEGRSMVVCSALLDGFIEKMTPSFSSRILLRGRT